MGPFSSCMDIALNKTFKFSISDTKVLHLHSNFHLLRRVSPSPCNTVGSTTQTDLLKLVLPFEVVGKFVVLGQHLFYVSEGKSGILLTHQCDNRAMLFPVPTSTLFTYVPFELGSSRITLKPAGKSSSISRLILKCCFEIFENKAFSSLVLSNPSLASAG